MVTWTQSIKTLQPKNLSLLGEHWRTFQFYSGKRCNKTVFKSTCQHAILLQQTSLTEFAILSSTPVNFSSHQAPDDWPASMWGTQDLPHQSGRTQAGPIRLSPTIQNGDINARHLVWPVAERSHRASLQWPFFHVHVIEKAGLQGKKKKVDAKRNLGYASWVWLFITRRSWSDYLPVIFELQGKKNLNPLSLRYKPSLIRADNTSHYPASMVSQGFKRKSGDR